MNSFSSRILAKHGQHLYIVFDLAKGTVQALSEYTKTVLGDVRGSSFYEIFNVDQRTIENITENEHLRLNVTNQDFIPETRDFYFDIQNEQVTAIGLLDHDDCMAALNTIHSTTTDLGQLSSALAREKSELEHLNELKSLFLAIAAHDLRNPLSSIIGYLELLSAMPEDSSPEQSNEFLSSVLDSATYMQSLLNQYLDVSRIDAGKLELNWKYHNLYLICKKCIEQNTIPAKAKGQTLVFEYDAPNICLCLDADKIEQVINNLLSNAIKFSDTGQTIVLDVESDEQHTTLSVQDSGPGIEENKLGSIFDRYQTAGNSGTPGNLNTGLGLYISRVIVESHGGKIWVNSQHGKGSRFLISLPLLDRASAFSEQNLSLPMEVAL